MKIKELIEQYGQECVHAYSYRKSKKAHEICIKRRDKALDEILFLISNDVDSQSEPSCSSVAHPSPRS